MKNPISTSITLASLATVSFAASATAQVFGSGPSDPALFDTVINLPADQASLAGGVGNENGSATPTTQLNLADGGSLDSRFDAHFGSEVNISGGNVGNSFDAFDGSVVNISGGSIGQDFDANDGSVVNISGGSIGRIFDARTGSTVNISGGTFEGDFDAESGSTVNVSGGSIGRTFVRSESTVNISGGTFGRIEAQSNSEINISGGSLGTFDVDFGSDVTLIGGEFQAEGIDFSESTVTVGFTFGQNGIFTGTLADGSVFIFENTARDSFFNANLSQANLPTPNTEPVFVSTDISGSPSGLRSGQTLTLQSGGVLGGNYAVVNATLNVEGGTVADGLEAAFSDITISGGTVGNNFDVNTGSTATISGGRIGQGFNALRDSAVVLSGGSVGANFNNSTGSELEIIGGDFRLNGTPYTAPTISIDFPDTAVFTGTLSDGSAFIFSNQSGDNLLNVALTTVPIPEVDLSPRVVNTNISGDPSGLNAGQSLTLQPGGVLGKNFAAIDSILEIQGGIVGDGLETTQSIVNISGGSISSHFTALAGSTVNITGGTIDTDFLLTSGSRTTISGGSVEDLRLGRGATGEGPILLDIQGGSLIGDVTVFTGNVNVNGGTVESIELNGSGGVVNLSGGNVGFVSTFNSGGILNISGGAISEGLIIQSDGELNLFGSNFSLDGVSLDDTLTFDEAFTLPDRDGAVLTATLADGSAFEVVLSERFSFSNPSPDIIRSDATLTLTLIASAIAGDYNNDGFVGQADLDLVLLNFGDTDLPEGFNTAALPNGPFDGLIGQNELDTVLLNFGSGAASTDITAVPEPTSVALLSLGAVFIASRRRRAVYGV